jgi:FlaA1/EpsC-like NDP-sugar epimerase
MATVSARPDVGRDDARPLSPVRRRAWSLRSGLAAFGLGGRIMVLRMLVDAGLVMVANVLSLVARFDGAIPAAFLPAAVAGLPVAAACYVAGFAATGTSRSVWRYTGVDDLWRLIKAASIGGMLHALSTLTADLWSGYPRSVLLLTVAMTILLTGGTRLLVRLSDARRVRPDWTTNRRLVIIGAGATGESIARNAHHAGNGYEIVGFVDDDPRLRGQRIHNLPVLGCVDALPDLASRYSLSEAIVAIPSLRMHERRRISALCQRAALPFKTLPSVAELVRGDGKLRYLRKMNTDELMSRERSAVDEARVRELLRSRCVLVTGAGGSIGSELCRQVLHLGAGCVVMVERAESALFEIAQEVRAVYGDGAAVPVLADVASARRMTAVFGRFRPELVFHAAAYKHVPMLEDHPIEAVLNNVVGTRRLVDVVRHFDVGTFVFISTDKAASPSSLMGATKKLGEMYVRAVSAAGHGSTRFEVVRFGNVLGSAGSVIPVFQRQVENGEPITITDPAASRFVMTISEAVGLVLQAAALARGGETFILDMGEPRTIGALADDLVVALGLSPAEIGQRTIGLRPGERLHERLWDEDEDVQRSDHEHIFVVRASSGPLGDLQALVGRLETLAERGRVAELLGAVALAVPTYGRSRRTPDAAPVAREVRAG